MEAIGQLAGGMAHDINNQLTIIQACVDLCLPRVEDEYLSNIFKKIRTAAERSANLPGVSVEITGMYGWMKTGMYAR
ncbi:MAG: hypothetical protein WBI44_11460 [Syntrophaceticus sp.]